MTLGESVQLPRKARARAIRQWIGVLRSATPGARLDAIRALAELRAAEAVGPLAALLGDLPLLRARVLVARLVYLLVGLPLPTRLRFGDERSDVRVAAVEALGQIGGARAVRALVRALSDEAPVVRTAAARALGRLDLSPDGPMLRQALVQVATVVPPKEVRLLALRLFGNAAPGAVAEALQTATDRLARALADREPNVRLEAIHGLWRIGARPSPAMAGWLLAQLQTNDPLLRIEAAKLLALGDDATRSRLIERLRQQLLAEDWQTRRTALIGLREVAVPEVFLDLAASFQRESYAPLRELALIGAVATGVPEARALATRALHDPSAHVRQRARQLLGLTDDESDPGR